MIDVWTWPTPNGHKVHIALEELGLRYRVIPVNIGAGDQFKPEFLAITPNHRIPAITDPDGPDGKAVTLFESGAILIYLAEKTGRLMPSDPAVARWHDAIGARPAVQRGGAVLADNQRKTPMTDEEREVMFGKTQFAAR